MGIGDIKLRIKFLISFLVIGLVPFMTIGFTSLEKAKLSLNGQSFAQLESIREIKKGQINRYLNTIKNQILTFSEDRMIISAMAEFNQAYEDFTRENGINGDGINRMKQELRTYYTDDFTEQYKKQNMGLPPDINSMFEGLDKESIALQYHYIKANKYPLGEKDSLIRADDKSAYSRLHKEVHPIIRNYLKKFGYYDIFLVNATSGDIVYSVFKELDYTTSLLDGPYADTHFGDAFRQAKNSKDKDVFIITDFAPYAPSYGAPAGFIASPICQGDEMLGVAIFQFPINELNNLMMERAGMGESGETYLVGPDKLMRSDSFLDPENHSVVKSFQNQEKGRVDTIASQKALSGKTGKEIIMDYNGNSVLSAYTNLKIGGLNWALIAEIDEAEAFAPIRSIQRLMIIIGLTGTGAIILAALFITQMIVGPIKRGVDLAKSMAGGDLTGRLDIHQKDEIGILGGALNSMAVNVGKMITEIRQGAATLASSASEFSHISQQMSAGAEATKTKSKSVALSSEEMSTNMEAVAAATEQASANFQMVATSTEEMSSTINEIAQNTEKARNISEEAVKTSGNASARVTNLREAAGKIGKVTETISNISSQTNLLALNATIEASRAGGAGKGFTVVANEIKDLATQTNQATSEIERLIHGIQDSSSETVTDITRVSDVIKDVNDIVIHVASAMEEQSIAVGEIATNINQASTGIQEVTGNISRSSETAAVISKDISGVDNSSRDLSVSSEQIKERAEELSVLAEQLNGMFARFKV